MFARFASPEQHHLFDAVLDVIRRQLRFDEPLIEPNYQYRDWFTNGEPLREISAACFGRLPAAYDTALIGVTVNTGEDSCSLVNSHRALGSPLILEVGAKNIGVWSVGASVSDTALSGEFSLDEFAAWAKSNSSSLEPTAFLRTKNIKRGQAFFFQKTLFAGLIPELEDRITDILEPRLTAAFAAGMDTYEQASGRLPPEPAVFKLAFWLLTGKVFSDRKHSKFKSLGAHPDPDDVLALVADHYKEDLGRLLNRETREAVYNRIWTEMDFRNLSVEVLAQIWSRTLVTPATRRRLGIHRTRKSIVDYIVDRIPFGKFDKEDCRVLEPCSGSASFLIGAMDRMRDLQSDSTSSQRHTYFKRMLRGYESDPFGVEISRLCLALADYPNPNHWRIEPQDVFTSESFPKHLAQTRVVLCNPPFRRFTQDEKSKSNAQYWERPAELLRIVLEHLHADGVLGFVLPRTFLNGKWYADIRGQLVGRFSDIEVVKLPDKGCEHADPETTLLVATKPSGKKRARVSYAAVREKDWQDFDWSHEVGVQNSASVSQAAAQTTLVVSELQPIWEYLEYCKPLGSIAKAKRGLRWTISLAKDDGEIVRSDKADGYVLGVRPRAKDQCAFQEPPLAYLSIKPKHQRYKAFSLPWDRPKVIMNKVAASRNRWRIAAFADFKKLRCNESMIPIWPSKPELTNALAAVLNSPVANAYLSDFSGKREFAYSLIHSIPFPHFSAGHLQDLDRLIPTYLEVVDTCELSNQPNPKADRALKEIDAVVLSAYSLPPRLERKLLNWFDGEVRNVPFRFTSYFPKNVTPYFSLKDWLSGRPAESTVARFRGQSTDLPGHISAALAFTDEETVD